jgi:hypothetical protein
MLHWLKTIFAKDRRRHPRFPSTNSGMAKVETIILRGRVLDISQGGFLFRPSAPTPLLASANLVLMLKGVNLAATIVRRSGEGLHCRFVTNLPPEEVEIFTAASTGTVEAEVSEAPATSAPQPERRQPAAKVPTTPDVAI